MSIKNEEQLDLTDYVPTLDLADAFAETWTKYLARAADAETEDMLLKWSIKLLAIYLLDSGKVKGKCFSELGEWAMKYEIDVQGASEDERFWLLALFLQEKAQEDAWRD